MKHILYHATNNLFNSFDAKYIGTGNDPNSALGFYGSTELGYVLSVAEVLKIMNPESTVAIHKIEYDSAEEDQILTKEEYYGDEYDETYSKEHFTNLRKDYLEDGIDLLRYEDEYGDMFVMLDDSKIEIKNTYSLEKFEEINKLNNFIREKIKFSDINIGHLKFSIENNLEYHSVAQEKNITKDDDLELIFETLLKGFIDSVIDLDNIDENKMKLYRAIQLESIEDLNPNLGIYWSFDSNNLEVFDDENYDHSGKNKKDYKRYDFTSEIDINDIDWEITFDLYIIQDFYESEIRLNKDAKFNNIKYKELGSEDFIPMEKSKSNYKIAVSNEPLKIYNDKEELTETNEKSDAFVVVIHDKDDNFLARGVFVQVEDNLYSTCGVVARKGYGELLYDTMAMVAKENDAYICIDRMASFVDQVDYLYQKLDKKSTDFIEIDDKHSDPWFNIDNKDRNPHYFRGYNLTPSKDFKDSLVSGKKEIEKMVDKSKSFFHIAYEIEGQSNTWIDKKMPIQKDKKLPTKFRLTSR